MKKTLLSSLLVILFITLTCWLGRFQILKWHYKKQWQISTPETIIKKHEASLNEDRSLLSKYDIFKPSKGSKDAGAYLNPKIHWQIGEVHHQGSLVLPEFVHKEMNKDWINKKPLFKKMGLDFSWMKELLQFDYWNPEENSPAFLEGKKYRTYSFPIPTYKDLMTWAKLRLLYGRERGDLISAFKEVRHLARLIWTNDYLVSSLVTVSILKFENEIHEGNWEIIPEDVLMRAKRYYYGTSSFTDPRFDDETFKKMTSTDVGICLMVVEGLMYYVSMRELMDEELLSQYERMNKLVQSTQSKCRQTIVHKMWVETRWQTIMQDEQTVFMSMDPSILLDKRMKWKELKGEPQLMAVVGYIMMGVASPNYLGGYDKKE